ncbi:unnamed protein product, partial [Symbiodinium sp. CCMP2456]
VSQLWGMQRDFSDELPAGDGAEPGEHTWMFFLLAPKWVKMRPTDAYYTVHPRSQGSAFRMSTAGSSVLLSLGSSVLETHDTPRRKDGSPRTGSAQSARGAFEPNRSQALSDRPKVDLALIEQAVSSLPAIKEGGNLRREAGIGPHCKAFTPVFLWGRGVAGDFFEVAPMPQAEVAEAVLVRRLSGPLDISKQAPTLKNKAVERLPAVKMPLPKTGSLFKDGD